MNNVHKIMNIFKIYWKTVQLTTCDRIYNIWCVLQFCAGFGSAYLLLNAWRTIAFITGNTFRRIFY